MSDEPPPEHSEHTEEEPRGTLVLMLLYLIVLIGLWGAVYYTLIDRGGS